MAGGKRGSSRSRQGSTRSGPDRSAAGPDNTVALVLALVGLLLGLLLGLHLQSQTNLLPRAGPPPVREHTPTANLDPIKPASRPSDAAKGWGRPDRMPAPPAKDDERATAMGRAEIEAAARGGGASSAEQQEPESEEAQQFNLLVEQGFRKLGKDEFADASTAFGEAVKLQPDSGQVQFNLGTALFELSKQEQSEEKKDELSDKALLAFEAAANHIAPEEGGEQFQISKVSALYNAGVKELLHQVKESMGQLDKDQKEEQEAYKRMSDNAGPKRFKEGATVYARLQHGWEPATVIENDLETHAYRMKLQDGQEIYAPYDLDKYVRKSMPTQAEEAQMFREAAQEREERKQKEREEQKEVPKNQLNPETDSKMEAASLGLEPGVECDTDEHGGQWCWKNADYKAQTPEGVVCTEMFDLNSSDTWLETMTAIVEQIFVCGFVYIAPGLVSDSWIREANQYVSQAWRDEEFLAENARPIHNGGRRVDIFMPLDSGPFNRTMFNSFDTKLFEILDAGPTGGGEISMVVVINAMPSVDGKAEQADRLLPSAHWRKEIPQTFREWQVGEEQIWHDDSMPGFKEKQLFIVVALHDTESGFIGVQPGCFPDKFHGVNYVDNPTGSDDKMNDKIEDEKPCFNWAGYVPRKVKAGTVMIHQARLRHRGFPQIVHDTRFMLSMDVAPNLDQHMPHFEKTWHGVGKNGMLNAERRKLFAERLENARQEIIAKLD